MERPDIRKGKKAPAVQERLVARTQSLEEAGRIAEQYSQQGFESWILRNEQGGIALFEVWVGKGPESIFSAGGIRIT